MQAARLFVYPSLYEGFGLPPAEAMACGIPTIASNGSSLPEIVGDAGILVDPNNTSELSRAIIRVVGDSSLAEDLAQAGPSRVARFNWKSAANSMNQIFADSLG
jgi:alpha-1,3-rhamnosyl/mannosyltransferase